MRKLLFLVVLTPAVAAAGHGAASATPTAPAQAPAPTARATVVYGDHVSLSGFLPEVEGPEIVTILARPYGETCWCRVGRTTTNAEGAFVYLVKPTIATRYQVTWHGLTTAALTVDVRPRLTFSVLSARRGTFAVKVEPGRPLAGRYVYLQRRVGSLWRSVTRVRYRGAGFTRFSARLPVGASKLRVFMPKDQTGPGYVAGFG